MEHIIEFCKDAESIYCNTTKIKVLEEKQLHIDIKNTGIYRTIYDNAGNCIFVMPLGAKHEHDMVQQLKRIQIIESVYPSLFSYRYNGQCLEVLALIPITDKHKVVIKKFGNMFSFINMLRNRINYLLRLNGLSIDIESPVVEPITIATGSINLETNAFCVDYQFEENVLNFYKRIISGNTINVKIKELNMSYWCKEIPPEFKASTKQFGNKHKYELTHDIILYYPPCIKRIMNKPNKGNYVRYLLATFLLGVHNKNDAKHMFLSLLSPEEAEHVQTGNCKDQWDTIVSRNYSPPSVKTMIDAGYFGDDDKIPPSLTNLEFYGYTKEE